MSLDRVIRIDASILIRKSIFNNYSKYIRICEIIIEISTDMEELTGLKRSEGSLRNDC